MSRTESLGLQCGSPRLFQGQGRMPPRNGGSQSGFLSPPVNPIFLLPWPLPPFAFLRGVLSFNLIFLVGILMTFHC